jgi:enoyl-CoA hydratase
VADDVLLIEKQDGVTTLTMNRPSAMNALSFELRSALTSAFRELSEDPDTGAIILTGAGRAFCAGLDLKELGGETSRQETANDPMAPARNFDLVKSMEDCAPPIIGAINGVAVTGGFEVALACDVLIASTQGRFADTHARVGIMPGWGLSQKLSRLVGISRAKEISLTGNFVSADQSAAWGLVNRVTQPEDLLRICRQLATDMLSCVPEVMRNYKRVIDQGYAETYASGREIETAANRENRISPEQIAARRKGIQERGRAQQ